MCSAKDIQAWALKVCRENGLRKTRALVDILYVFAHTEAPLSIQNLESSRRLKGHYDAATLYRLLGRLEKIELIQKLGFKERAAYFVLRFPGRHHDYLICSACGIVEQLDIACPVHNLENQISKKSGFSNLHHELEFFGTCPACSS